MRGDYGEEIQIYMRRNHDMTADSVDETTTNNLAQISGEWILDLGKNVATVGVVGFGIYYFVFRKKK